MDVATLLLEFCGRILPLARKAIDGVDLARPMEPPSPGANPIAWLVWHVAAVHDHHIAEILGDDQIWVAGDWHRFGLDRDPANTGYGHTAAEVATVRPQRAADLLDYLEAVDRRERNMLQTLSPDDLDRIGDRRWDPPVTLDVRLVSIADDGLQHAGQAAYVLGLTGQ